MAKQRGAGLLELVVVLGVLAIVAAAGVPGIIQWLPVYRLKNAVSDIHSNLQLAKLIAVKQNQDCSISFDTGPDRYAVQALNKTVILEAYGSGVHYARPDEGNPIANRIITFNSRGSSNQGYVYLTNAAALDFYRVGPLWSGVIRRQKWTGSSWK